MHLGLLGLEHSLKWFEFLISGLLLKLALISFQLIDSPSGRPMESSSIEIFDCAISPACLASLCPE